MYAAGGDLFKTTNGGASWQTVIAMPNLGPWFVDVCFRDNNYGIALATNSVSYRTTDGGTTWNRLADGGLTKIDNSSLDINSSLENMAIKGNVELMSGRHGLLRNVNGPNYYWEKISMAPYESIVNRLRYSRDGSAAFLDGKLSGIMYKSENDGRFWKRVNTGTSNTVLNDVTMDNAGNGISVGRYGMIWQTVNGGADWEPQVNDYAFPYTRHDLLDVELKDSHQAWAVGAGGMLLHSSDAGYHWKRQPSGTTNTLNQVTFINDLEGWVSGDTRIMKTINGGAAWNTILTNPARSFVDIKFLDANEGWVISNSVPSVDTTFLLKTTDGGTNWSRKLVISYPYSFYTFCPLMGIDVISAAELRTFTKDTIYHSLNGGQTWAARPAPAPVTNLRFLNQNIGYLVSGYLIYYTSDGGVNWGLCRLKDGVELQGVEVYPGGAFISGTGGVVIKNNANPLNEADWQFQMQPREFGDGNGVFYFLNRQTGWKHDIVGNNISFTSNGGKSWKVYSNFGDTAIAELHFSSGNTGYAAGDRNTGTGGLYSKTTDAGKTWQTFPVGISGEAIGSISFYDDNHGFLAGNNGLLINTNDGLATRTQSHLPSGENIREVIRTGLHSGWINTVAKIYYTTNDGQTWTPKSLPAVVNAIIDISFINDSTGLVLVSMGGTEHTYYTSDYGASWSYAPISPNYEEISQADMNQNMQAIAIPFGMATGIGSTFIFGLPVDTLAVDFTIDTLDFCNRTIRLNATSNTPSTTYSWIINSVSYSGTPITITAPAGTDTLHIALYGNASQSAVCNVTTTLLDSLKSAIGFDSIPLAKFRYAAVCNNTRFNFTDESSVTDLSSRYHWEFGDGDTSNLRNPSHTYLAPGPYTVSLQVYSKNGCPSLPFTANIIAGDVPDISLTKTNDIDCSHPSSKLSAPPGYNYVWSPAGSLSNPNIADPVATPGATQLYTITLTNNDGCKLTDTITVVVTAIGASSLMLPTGFTPNNDGLNDCIGVITNAVFKNFTYRIYNRWGELVFSTSNPSACWNGYFKGVLQETANFVYYLKAESDCGVIEKKGNLALIR